MSEHLLTEIHIKDFKCFKDFKADGFKRVNLIGGKNNVGKTAFMEACYVNVSSINIDIAWTTLFSLYVSRNNLEYVENKMTREHIIEKLEVNNGFCTISNINKLMFSFMNKETIINSNEFAYNVETNAGIKFIDNYGYTNRELKE